MGDCSSSQNLDGQCGSCWFPWAGTPASDGEQRAWAIMEDSKQDREAKENNPLLRTLVLDTEESLSTRLPLAVPTEMGELSFYGVWVKMRLVLPL